MKAQLKVAAGLYVLAMLIMLGFGVTYVVRDEFMPYHAEAVGMPWSEVPAGFKVLIRALMTALGISQTVLAITMLILLVFPFRRGEAWVIWAIPCMGMLQTLGVAAVQYHVAQVTSAHTPLLSSFLGGGILLLAFGLSYSSIRMQRPV